MLAYYGRISLMKKLAKKLVLWVLKVLAKRRLKRFKGRIVGVTGSVGKTSTKEAIFSILNTQYKVKRSRGSMNSDFGLLLTILDIESGYSSATKWTWYLMKGFVHSFMRDHSEVMVLELGVDKPGDMNFLTSVVKPDVAVFTNVAPVHIDEGQFKDAEEILEEKAKILRAVKPGGVAILNLDNKYTERAYKSLKKGRIGFSAEKEADYYVSRVKSETSGLSFVLKHRDEKQSMHTSVLGRYQIYVLLPAIACAKELGMTLEQIAVGVERFVLPPGRMSLIEGVEGIELLDSSYNSSPLALASALSVLLEVGEDRRKVAVVGNMNELGQDTESLHKQVGKVAAVCCDVLITVGKEAKFVADAALENGMPAAQVFSFTYAKEAAEFYKKHLKPKDLVLVKGSQNRVRLERFVKEFMARPEEADELLVRQGKVWQAKL